MVLKKLMIAFMLILYRLVSDFIKMLSLEMKKTNTVAILEKHPCFSNMAIPYGRIHLPVSPTCNISCKFCKRTINKYESRPGVAERIITPTEAVERTRQAISKSNNLTVVGIAGPGDPLATPYALETLKLINKAFPHLLKCMSTNGLCVIENYKKIISVGLDSITITVNAVDPNILIHICNQIYFKGNLRTGKDAAKILIHNQIEGIMKLSKFGIPVKVNTVLIPKINGVHISDIAKTINKAGAVLYNIIPLISQNEFINFPNPTCMEINNARAIAGKYITIFKRCKQCRADAIGVL